MSHLDLRVGATFAGPTGSHLHQAINDAAETITRMPAHYTTYADGQPIFPVRKRARIVRPDPVRLDPAYLYSFGDVFVPRHFWRALQRFDVWIEPAVIAEWSRLIKRYAARQGRPVKDGSIAAAMVWDEPTRDVRVARERAISLADARELYCVWTGRRMRVQALDVDHCLPWSAWPCGDLWNLMPAGRSVNQREKRARLPSDAVLRSAEDRIVHWWEKAYASMATPIHDQFWIEAKSSLPTLAAGDTGLTDLFDALRLQRIRLKRDQQFPEWEGRAR